MVTRVLDEAALDNFGDDALSMLPRDVRANARSFSSDSRVTLRRATLEAIRRLTVFAEERGQRFARYNYIWGGLQPKEG